MTETIETRRKRLYMRSIRRGIKEMDVILTAFAGERLSEMDEAGLDAYEALIAEQDLDLYPWINGQEAPPAEHQAMVNEIRSQFNEVVERNGSA
ncbi:MAG: succinate dehydrogenase assembly factor 2 [Rhodobacteraceae bacterium]|nr:succinate dehydrogenase assembly factor 2 [Paracoccaceae bacterium]